MKLQINFIYKIHAFSLMLSFIYTHFKILKRKALENIVEKGQIAQVTSIFSNSSYFCTFLHFFFLFELHLILLPAKALDLIQSKILLFGEEIHVVSTIPGEGQERSVKIPLEDMMFV